MSQQFQIEIVNVGAPISTPNGRGGFYKSVEVAYKAGGKVSGWTVRDFVNKDVYNALLKAQSGQRLLITKAKNDKGYDQWVGVAPWMPDGNDVAGQVGESVSEESTSSPSTDETRQSFRGRGGRVVGNTYETPEERATKQAIITRAGLVNSAIEVLKAQQSAVNVNTVTTAAVFLEEFIYADLEERAKRLKATSDSLKK